MSKKSIRKKKHHNLFDSRNASDFKSRMIEMGIDLESLIAEFVNPEYQVGVVLGGSIPERTATSVSDVDISLLIRTPDALKDFREVVWGASVFYLHRNKATTENWAVLFYEGVEINFEIKINSNLDDTNTSLHEINLNTEDVGEQRFLSRIASGWPLFNEQEVELWRTYYCVDQLRERKIISEFTLAIKELEDMKSALGGSPGLSYILGVHITTRLIKSLLASEEYFSPGVKWMRKVNQLIKLDDDKLAPLLVAAREQLFPRYDENVTSERDYYDSVVKLICMIEKYISDNNMHVGDVVDWVKTELDLKVEDL